MEVPDEVISAVLVVITLAIVRILNVAELENFSAVRSSSP